MITLISGTNRPGSETLKIAKYIAELLRARTSEAVAMIDLVQMKSDVIRYDMYKVHGQSKEIMTWQDELILPAHKFWFVFPEYNGGVPGILKLFLDAISVRNLNESFHGKKACLTGVSSGRAGNLRGLDHLTNILNYLQVIVLPNRLPISSIRSLNDANGVLTDELTIEVLSQQVEEFLAF